MVLRTIILQDITKRTPCLTPPTDFPLPQGNYFSLFLPIIASTFLSYNLLSLDFSVLDHIYFLLWNIIIYVLYVILSLSHFPHPPQRVIIFGQINIQYSLFYKNMICSQVT